MFIECLLYPSTVLGAQHTSEQKFKNYPILNFLHEGGVLLKNRKPSRALVAHSYNPRYSGGRDQEDHDSKPAQANTLQDLISENPITKKAGGTAQV
jgi:hypothetical protein